MLTFGVNYFLLANQNLIILVLLDSSGSYLSIDINCKIWISFGHSI